jgi:hypothetical protein
MHHEIPPVNAVQIGAASQARDGGNVCVIQHLERTLNSLESPSLIASILAFVRRTHGAGPWTFNLGMGATTLSKRLLPAFHLNVAHKLLKNVNTIRDQFFSEIPHCNNRSCAKYDSPPFAKRLDELSADKQGVLTTKGIDSFAFTHAFFCKALMNASRMNYSVA